MMKTTAIKRAQIIGAVLPYGGLRSKARGLLLIAKAEST